jgi:hypothetical protein
MGRSTASPRSSEPSCASTRAAATAAGLRAKADRMKMGKRAQAFLDVFTPSSTEYQKRLGAGSTSRTWSCARPIMSRPGATVSPFRHILVDEFQDISAKPRPADPGAEGAASGRARLRRGDDWQSIFRFAGSDIHMMRNFGREFGGTFDGETGMHRSVDLGRTFRSVDKIAFAAEQFVLRNPAQIHVTELRKDPAYGIADSTWRGAGKPCLRRMRWAVAGRDRAGWPHLVSLRACPALRKPAARLPILRDRSATPREWNGRGSMWLRCHLSDVPRMRRWLAGRTQRQLWKVPWLRPLSDLCRESEDIERGRSRSAAMVPLAGVRR